MSKSLSLSQQPTESLPAHGRLHAGESTPHGDSNSVLKVNITCGCYCLHNNNKPDLLIKISQVSHCAQHSGGNVSFLAGADCSTHEVQFIPVL